MAWLRAVADALDETGLYFNKQPIPGSTMAVDADVYKRQDFFSSRWVTVVFTGGAFG